MRTLRFLFILVTGYGSLLTPSPAQVPSLINYQGRLLNGTNLANGNFGLSLRLFNLPSGGTSIYEDSNNVAVADGIYSTLIGDQTNSGNFANALTNAQVWVEVAVNGAALTPRERLASVAYALVAGGAAAGSITSAMLANGAVTTDKLAANAVTTATLADGAVLGGKIASNTITTANVADGGLLAQDFATVDHLLSPLFITNPAPAAADNFGFSVAGVGTDRFVVGADQDDNGSNNAGSAYLYDVNGNLLVTITNPAPENDDNFGYSVAGVGPDRFVVGAYRDNAFTNNSGSVYLYDINGILLAAITNPTPVPGDFFGSSVSSVGTNRFVVGARLDRTGADFAGSAYLFDFDGTLLVTITNPTPVLLDQFGNAVAGVGSDRFVVGAPLDDAGATNAGSAYLYDLNGNLLATITNPAPASDDQFGAAMAGIGSDRFVVGAYLDSAGATNAGSAYLYDLNGNLLMTITNPAPAASDNFGYAVAGRGSNRVVIGAFADDTGATNAGSAYLYDLDGNLLASIPNPAPAVQDQFGASVADVGLNGFAVGAFGDNVGANDAGSVYLYSFVDVVTGLVADSVMPHAIGVEQLDTASVDARYVVKTGDTMTGALAVPTIVLSATNEVITQLGEFNRRTVPIAHIVNTGLTSIAIFNPYNCAAARLGPGSYRIIIATDPSTPFYNPVVTPIADGPRFVTITNRTASLFEFNIYNATGAVQDAGFSVTVFGGF